MSDTSPTRLRPVHQLRSGRPRPVPKSKRDGLGGLPAHGCSPVPSLTVFLELKLRGWNGAVHKPATTCTPSGEGELVGGRKTHSGASARATTGRRAWKGSLLKERGAHIGRGRTSGRSPLARGGVTLRPRWTPSPGSPWFQVSAVGSPRSGGSGFPCP